LGRAKNRGRSLWLEQRAAFVVVDAAILMIAVVVGKHVVVFAQVRQQNGGPAATRFHRPLHPLWSQPLNRCQNRRIDGSGAMVDAGLTVLRDAGPERGLHDHAGATTG